jgi:hypothetical protein
MPRSQRDEPTYEFDGSTKINASVSSGTSIFSTLKDDVNIFNVVANSNVTGNACLKLQNVAYLWVDSTGDLRINPINKPHFVVLNMRSL